MAQASRSAQGASSSSQSLEDMMGDELEKTLVTAREELVAAREETVAAQEEAQFWEEAAQELKKEEASVYAESETELWFNNIVEG